MRKLGLNQTLLRGLALGFALGFVAALACVHLPGASWEESASIIREQLTPLKQNDDIDFAFDRARRLGLSYKEIMASPKRFIGDPVLWDIELSVQEGGIAFVNEDIGTPVRWTGGHASPACPAAGGKDHRTYTILAKVHEVKKSYIELQYLGCR